MKNNETIQQVGLVMGCTLLALILAGGVDNLIVKPLVARPRPSSDPIIKYMVDVVAGYRGKDFSFFSAHAANTMAVATFQLLDASSFGNALSFRYCGGSGMGRVFR